MTREEAILILEEEAEFLYGGDEPYNKIAFDMAIEALSKPNYETATEVRLAVTNRKKEMEDKGLFKRVDFVEVVRCKDCRHIYINDFCSFYGCPTEADGYCNNGERSET